MHADEQRARKLRFPRRQRTQHEQRRSGSEVQLGVVARGADEGDVANADEARAPRVIVKEKIVVAIRGRLRHSGRRQRIASSSERGREAHGIHRLQQVVERMDLERPERVLVEGGHEDHFRQARHAHSGQHPKAIHFRHLNVEKDEVGLVLFNRFDCRAPIAAFANDLEVGFRFEKRAQPLAGQRFVINDQRADLHGRHSLAPIARTGPASGR